MGPLGVLLLVGGGLLVLDSFSSNIDESPGKEGDSPLPHDDDVSIPPMGKACSPDPSLKITIMRKVGDGEGPSDIAQKITGNRALYFQLLDRNPGLPIQYEYDLIDPNAPPDAHGNPIVSDHLVFERKLTDIEVADVKKTKGLYPILVRIAFKEDESGKDLVIPEAWFPYYRTLEDGSPYSSEQGLGQRYPICPK